MQFQPTIWTFHYLFIADENGINYLFPSIKERLVESALCHVSLIYYSNQQKYLFKKELDVLEKHFPSQFIPYYDGTDSTSEAISSEIVETIYSSNTRNEIISFISGGEEFMEHAKTILQFLGIHKINKQPLLFNLN